MERPVCLMSGFSVSRTSIQLGLSYYQDKILIHCFHKNTSVISGSIEIIVNHINFYRWFLFLLNWCIHVLHCALLFSKNTNTVNTLQSSLWLGATSQHKTLINFAIHWDLLGAIIINKFT